MHPPIPGDSAARLLDQKFDAGTLGHLRQAVRGCAAAGGMSPDRAIDMMLAIHELAANAVRHGAGHGRVRIHRTAGALQCEVSDPGPASREPMPGSAAGQPCPYPVAPAPWPIEYGHGLWLVDTAADQLAITSGPRTTLAIAVFALTAVGPHSRPRTSAT